MEDLIRQAFLHVDIIGPHVAEGHYDLIGPNNEIILPGVWETVIEPDWTITMHMWPMPEPKAEEPPVVEVPEVAPEATAAEAAKKGRSTPILYEGIHTLVVLLLCFETSKLVELSEKGPLRPILYMPFNVRYF